MNVVGYSDRLRVEPGQTVAFKVSTTFPEYDADLVRLIHGDDDPAGPGVKQEPRPAAFAGTYRGRRQVLRRGSYVRCPTIELRPEFELDVWICPTAPNSGEQAVVSHGPWTLLVNHSGHLELRIGGLSLAVESALLPWEWYHLAVVVSESMSRLVCEPLRHGLIAPAAVAASWSHPVGAGSFPVVIAAALDPDGDVHQHFNGKIEAPTLTANGLTFAQWDFSRGISTRLAIDVSAHSLDAEVVNMPMRAVTGRRWSGATVAWPDAPEEYAAIHFHDDDLDDAEWETDFEWTVPPDCASGVYAARLRGGESIDYLPFFVRPPRGVATAEVAFLAPTFSYLAYANEHYSWSPAFRMWAPGDVMQRLTERDHYMAAERLLSIYDFHTDGTGPCYSSARRPLLSLRPGYDMPLISAPHQFNADLHLLDWLESRGFERDVITDHDLHEEGVQLLSRYRVLVTGSHPEYWSGSMLDALAAYLVAGGRVMYLGGNGFWWVTSVHPAAPHVIEVRRGLSGSRPSTSRPGEVFHAGTAEFGGQWRYRGRAPQALIGVGYTSQGSDASRPYQRLPASHDPRVAWIFEGIGADELIGDFGLVLGAAGGAEIDRADTSLGTPPHALVVAQATGFSDMYQAALDDTLLHDSKQGGTQSPLVRADMVYYETRAGGAVFSPGSISWCGSLSHADYDNNVSRITENVLRRFLDPVPIPFPA